MSVLETRKKERADTGTSKSIEELLFSKSEPTVLVLEKMLEDTVQLKVAWQKWIDRTWIPKEARNFFNTNGTFLYRLSSIHYKGKVLSESLAFADISLLQEKMIEKLETGNIPIEKLVQQIETRRNILYQGYQPSGNILALFDGFSLKSSIFPTVKYQILQNLKCIFYICEIFHADNLYHLLYKCPYIKE
ncbi:hypothetical protein ERICIV_01988 [Paenibacillus larvae subsp. larvae]|uniref:Cold-shock protein n=1 Tax=Paenibacillus larvae subsp. larvae TaxID=147375 RepID=A0A2L1UDA4_9BACL|nr:cold-shock protein [Paenibacillus larvae]AQZ48177.1 cold-shock protein [Paenibacillus larvae subsp. pulvifaciens]AVF26137.1 hypothetical protein ERICIII_01966 [Paenibacillus larvae subsp. larvae]AVF30915.1 hypothetical protein ERICIV_01988 [Paenibacillus larvae subsp. larvae]MBH0343975.1 cold-shock protein [Paenibacillus larvae]MCY7518327.1 cold-shock protein [Paenibacillus larvae]